jgi:aspartyl-tRNA synthetase
MPPTSGLGIGMDRLMMYLNNNNSYSEVHIPQMTYSGATKMRTKTIYVLCQR